MPESFESKKGGHVSDIEQDPSFQGKQTHYEKAIVAGECLSVCYFFVGLLIILNATKMMMQHPPLEAVLCNSTTLHLENSEHATVVVDACKGMYVAFAAGNFVGTEPQFVGGIWALLAALVVGLQSKQQKNWRYRTYMILTATFGGLAACVVWAPAVAYFMITATVHGLNFALGLGLQILNAAVPTECAGGAVGNAACETFHTAYQGYSCFSNICGCMRRAFLLFSLFELLALLDVFRMIAGLTCAKPDVEKSRVEYAPHMFAFLRVKVHKMRGVDGNALKINPLKSKVGRGLGLYTPKDNNQPVDNKTEPLLA